MRSLDLEMEEAEIRKFEDLMALKDEDRIEMVKLFKKQLEQDDFYFLKRIIKEHPDGKWVTDTTNSTHSPFHFRGGGIKVRNFFRSSGYTEKKLGIENLDNVYASIVEEAINGMSKVIPKKRSWLSKLFFW